MLADIFYLSTAWLIVAFVAVLWLGPRQRFTSFIWSVSYLVVITGLGDLVALLLFGEPAWIVEAGSLDVLFVGLVFIVCLRDWNAPGQVFFLFSVSTTVLYLLYAFVVTAVSQVSLFAFLFSFLLLLLETAALTLSLTYAFEVLDVLCRVRWRRQAAPRPLGTYVPRVSLHVPAYNEPPELVEKTLRALAQLNYPNYEVILIDNNTPDEALWQPLARVCREFGFKCLHLEKWPGYKSGALNFGLAMTDPRAELIGVIDADYIIEPDFLRRIVPYFEDPAIAFVQAPQDYRDFEKNRFFQAAYDGYKYFFELSMPARNERNAIIFCGTMGLLRKNVLQEIGGWDEWCITEDAEASLRILNRGYKSLFIRETFGRGLMPLDFEGLKKQRFRWAFGGVQILKKHWGKLMPWAGWVDPENKLSGAQRYFYLMSGLQWFNALLTFTFSAMVIISAMLTIAGHTEFLRPTAEAFVVLPIVLIGTNMLRALWGLRHALHTTWKRAFYALTLWFALTWVVALACIQAVVQKRGVFLRTPKTVTNVAWARALLATSFETIVGAACVMAGLAVVVLVPSPLTIGLLVLALVQGLIYLSAPSHSLLSLATGRGRYAYQPDRANIYGAAANESRLGIQLALAAFIVGIVVLVASLWPAPTGLPSWFTVVNPQPLISPQAQPPVELPALVIPRSTATPTGTATPGTFTPTATGSASPTPTQIGTTPAATSTATSAPPSATPTPASTSTSPPSPTSTAPAPTSTTASTATPAPGATP